MEPESISAEDVRAAIERLGWTQRELSRRLGVHVNTAHGWCVSGGPAWLGVHLRLLVSLADLVNGPSAADV